MSIQIIKFDVKDKKLGPKKAYPFGALSLQTSLRASDLPTIRSTDIRSIRSVDSFFSHPIYNWQIGKIDRMTIISIGIMNNINNIYFK